MIHQVKKVIKTSGDLDYTKQALLTNTDTFFRYGNTDMVDKERKSKQNVVEESITPPIS